MQCDVERRRKILNADKMHCTDCKNSIQCFFELLRWAIERCGSVGIGLYHFAWIQKLCSAVKLGVGVWRKMAGWGGGGKVWEAGLYIQKYEFIEDLGGMSLAGETNRWIRVVEGHRDWCTRKPLPNCSWKIRTLRQNKRRMATVMWGAVRIWGYLCSRRTKTKEEFFVAERRRPSAQEHDASSLPHQTITVSLSQKWNRELISALLRSPL